MEISDEQIAHAINNTEVLRSPRQTLATFGNTSVRYFLLTEPLYKDLVKGPEDTVIREGRVISQKPRVVTPGYMISLEGFGDNARKYFQELIQEAGPDVPGLLYLYRNEPKELNVVSGSVLSVLERLEKEIENDPLTAIIRGVDEMWDVCLLKFIHDLTAQSLEGNLRELGSRGMMNVDQSGVTIDARRQIEDLFYAVRMKKEDPDRLKRELDRWGVFREYEDRFLALFS